MPAICTVTRTHCRILGLETRDNRLIHRGRLIGGTIYTMAYVQWAYASFSYVALSTLTVLR